MSNQQEILRQLQQRLQQLIQQQQQLQRDIQGLKISVEQLTGVQVPATPEPIVAPPVPPTPTATLPEPSMPETPQITAPKPPVPTRRPLEEFVGTNLLNKIGIGVMIIGIGIGISYAIDHNLISPFARIILGYLAGLVLLGFAWWLKAKYKNFSAVLLAGGMATLYFVTFTSYSVYEFIHQVPTFVLMVLFTIITVYFARWYDLQAIAVIGLVGAYAVPFLLSDGSGRVVILYTYMSIINLGILALAYRARWNILLYVSFGLSWLVMLSWFVGTADADRNLAAALIFSTIFQLTFYAILILRKLNGVERHDGADTAMIMLNTFVCYLIGYGSLDVDAAHRSWQGLYTLLSAVPHIIAALLLFKKKSDHPGSLWLTVGLAASFVTMAVPVQLDGNWVTLLWAAEAALLVWVGRTRVLPRVEYMGYAVLVLFTGSLLSDWQTFYRMTYDDDTVLVRIPMFLNKQFLVSCLGLLSVVVVWQTQVRYAATAPYQSLPQRKKLLETGVMAFGAAIIFLMFFKEIQFYWTQRYYGSRDHDTDLFLFRNLWGLIYAAVYTSTLGWLAIRYQRQAAGVVALVMAGLVLLIGVSGGLGDVSELTNSYLSQLNADVFVRDYQHVLIRYGLIVALVPILFLLGKLTGWLVSDKSLSTVIRIGQHVVVLALLSSELIHWLTWYKVEHTDTLALSLLWGAYALGLIIVGFRQRVQLHRVMGMSLFGITLLKLLFYDLGDMSTGARTVVLVLLGVLMLVASFLYNKFKSRLQ